MTIVSNQKLSGDQELAVNTENWRMITDRYAVRTSTFFFVFFIAFIEEDSALVAGMHDMLAI
jgi:hypothetical protein